MKRIVILLLILNILSMPVLALDLDTSVDDEIRKNYNPNLLEDDVGLPPLPKILNEPTTYTPKKIPLKHIQAQVQPQSQAKIEAKAQEIIKNNVSTKVQAVEKPAQKPVQKPVPVTPAIKPVAEIQKTQQMVEKVAPVQAPLSESQIHKVQLPEHQAVQIAKATKTNSILLSKGTRIKVRIITPITDKTKKGTRVKFVSLYPVSTTFYTIPMGTEFYGQVVNVHGPQFSANGGLIEISINSMIVNGETQPIDAFVIRANHKLVFFNAVKGKRKYLTSMAKSTKSGRHFYHKMMRTTRNMASRGSTFIVAPFTLFLGLGALGGNIMAAPALGLCYKGGHVILNTGSELQIKFAKDIYIYN